MTTDTVRKDRIQQLYSDRWIGRLKSFVARRYPDMGDWEGWFEEAHQNLALKVDAMPVEQTVSDALVFAIFKNELITVKRNRLGYPRPRAWLRQFSELGQDLFEWMCLKKLSREKIIALAEKKVSEKSYNHTVLRDASDENADHKNLLIKLTDTMIEKRECDGVRPSVALDINDDSVVQIPADTPSTEQTADHTQLEVLLSMLLGVDRISDELKMRAVDRIEGLRADLVNNPILDDMDILVIRCYYFQGMSQNDIAKLTKQPLQRVVRRREAAIKRIRQFMESHGLTKDAFEL